MLTNIFTFRYSNSYISSFIVLLALYIASVSPATAANKPLSNTNASSCLIYEVPIIISATVSPDDPFNPTGYWLIATISGGDPAINAFGSYVVSGNFTIHSGSTTTSGGTPIALALGDVNGNPFQLGDTVSVYSSDGCCAEAFLTVIIYDVPEPITWIPFGVVFYDINQNGLFDEAEPILSNQDVQFLSTNATAYTNINGQFEGNVPQTNNYQINYTPPANWQATTATQYTINIASGQSLTNYNFGIYPTTTINQGNLFVYSSVNRCNLQAAYYISYLNTGTTFVDGIISFTPNPLTTYSYANTPPDSIGADGTLYWHYSNLAPYQQFSVNAIYQMPNADYMGSILAVTANTTATTVGSTNTVTYNYTYEPTLTCSYDPNDKQVLPEGIGNAHYTLMDEELIYTIRFQNTGNDTAFTVVVRDTLADNIDANSFELISSSHLVATTRYNNGLVTFTFNNINLPDSSTNQIESNGYVSYRVKVKTGLANNTPINNTAYIYFDQNDAIVTNTTLNTMVYELPNNNPLPINLGTFKGTITTKGNVLDWQTFGEQNNDYFMVQRANTNGIFIDLGKISGAGNSTTVRNYSFVDTKPASATNYYRLAQVDYDGTIHYSQTIALANEGQQQYSLSPNPANDYLLIHQNKEAQATQYTVCNVLGNVVAKGSFTASTHKLNVANLPKGSYFITLQQATQTQSLQWVKE
ncbi:MAG: T9SS type A sorting domain-containing protein [Chitinophagales bacterium]|nr:T9SS type A sorting domain-containing protein [Chitinophagales bacterium]MBP7532978.1 T9SS type A sorting domain-containing protein [Chitinophagales bacterium]